jgi:hypothetical protein
VEEETGRCTPRDRRDRGPGTQGSIRRHKEQPTKLRISRGAMVEKRTQLAIERGGLGNPPPTAGASGSIPTIDQGCERRPIRFRTAYPKRQTPLGRPRGRTPQYLQPSRLPFGSLAGIGSGCMRAVPFSTRAKVITIPSPKTNTMNNGNVSVRATHLFDEGNLC